MPGNPTKRVETYALVACPITEGDIPKLHELSVGVGWMHRREDWEMALSIGQGIFAVDEIGRAVASAMYFPMGEDLATVGMVITAPRFQEHGTGSWMMEQILATIGERDLALNATHVAYRLYYSLGFRPEATVFQHHGFAAPKPPTPPALPAGTVVRAMGPEDTPTIRALDATAFDGAREDVLMSLLAASDGTILERDGVAIGYAFCRPFGRGHVIGPVIASSEEEAIALIAPHIAARPGQFLRMDTREEKGVLRDYLTASGMRMQATATTMLRGKRSLKQNGLRVFGLATQALG